MGVFCYLSLPSVSARTHTRDVITLVVEIHHRESEMHGFQTSAFKKIHKHLAQGLGTLITSVQEKEEVRIKRINQS